MISRPQRLVIAECVNPWSGALYCAAVCHQFQRPCHTSMLIYAQSSVPQPVCTACLVWFVDGVGLGQLSCRSLNITVALYEQGALLLADTISENNSRVVLVARDLTTPPVGISTGSGPGLREYVSVIDRPTAGNNMSASCGYASQH